MLLSEIVPLLKFMMKKLVFIIFLLIFATASAQSNIFEKSESESFYNDASAMESDSTQIPEPVDPNGPPDGDDLPVDEYVPVLVIIAIGLIIGTRYIKKTTI